MTEKERKIVCVQFEQIKKLFLEYENYISKNRIKIKKEQIIEKSIYISFFLIAFNIFLAGAKNLLFGTNPLEIDYLIFVIAFFASVVIYIMLVSISEFLMEKQKWHFSKEEIKIYRNNKCIYSVLEELSFPQDYMCSEFVQVVIDEIRCGEKNHLEDIYLKCKCADFDLYSKTAKFISKNRFYVNKVKNLEV